MILIGNVFQIANMNEIIYWLSYLENEWDTKEQIVKNDT